jgi:hypothetical protein
MEENDEDSESSASSIEWFDAEVIPGNHSPLPDELVRPVLSDEIDTKRLFGELTWKYFEATQRFRLAKKWEEARFLDDLYQILAEKENVTIDILMSFGDAVKQCEKSSELNVGFSAVSMFKCLRSVFVVIGSDLCKLEEFQ